MRVSQSTLGHKVRVKHGKITFQPITHTQLHSTVASSQNTMSHSQSRHKHDKPHLLFFFHSQTNNSRCTCHLLYSFNMVARAMNFDDVLAWTCREMWFVQQAKLERYCAACSNSNEYGRRRYETKSSTMTQWHEHCIVTKTVTITSTEMIYVRCSKLNSL